MFGQEKVILCCGTSCESAKWRQGDFIGFNIVELPDTNFHFRILRTEDPQGEQAVSRSATGAPVFAVMSRLGYRGGIIARDWQQTISCNRPTRVLIVKKLCDTAEELIDPDGGSDALRRPYIERARANGDLQEFFRGGANRDPKEFFKGSARALPLTSGCQHAAVQQVQGPVLGMAGRQRPLAEHSAQGTRLADLYAPK